MITFPTSNDISIEVNGRKLAVAQGYRAKSNRESRYVEAFGSAEPVGTVGGRVNHQLELTTVKVCDKALADGVNFHELSGFNVVIVKPDKKIIYSGCEWASIDEVAALGNVVTEAVSIVAARRMEMA